MVGQINGVTPYGLYGVSPIVERSAESNSDKLTHLLDRKKAEEKEISCPKVLGY